MLERADEQPSTDPATPLKKTRRSWPRRILVRCYRTVVTLLALGMAAQLVLVFTPLTDRIRNWLDVTQPPEPADVLVCLGGHDSRLLWTANLFHRDFAPVVVVSNKPGAAEAMRSRLVMAGVPTDKILVDRGSSNTGDHPGSIAALDEIDPETQRFIIVTSEEHSRRAAACFRKAGYANFIVCGERSTSAGAAPDQALGWHCRTMVLPSLAYECAALLQYWWQGKI